MKGTIVISASTLALLEAHALPGSKFVSGVRARADGRFDVSVEDDVADSLAIIHDDPDLAIRLLCSSGVGHA